MSICHTVRFRVQNTRGPEAREAIDAYVSALEDASSRRLVLASQLLPRRGDLEFLQVSLCAGPGACHCDDSSPAGRAFRDAIRRLATDGVEERTYEVVAERHPD